MLSSPLLIPRDQFTEPGAGRRMPRLRIAQLLLMLPAVVVGGFSAGVGIHLSSPAGLLTATSILTGITFSMATTFWTKSIEARRRPDQALNSRVLDELDTTRTHLIWTVAVGVTATALLALISVFWPSGAPIAVSAVAAALIIYMLTMVGMALHRFYVTSIILR
jgi:hypothetical protein